MKSNLKKSVCFICYRNFPDTNFENYSHFVSEAGYHVTVVAFKAPGQKSFEIIGNRKIYRVTLPQTNQIRRKWWAFAVWVIKFLRHNNFSIVHIHNTCPYFLSYKVFANFRSKYVYHNTSYPVSTSKYRTYKRMIIDFLQALFMDRLIIQSEELKNRLVGIRNLAKTQVMPIGFNSRLFHPTVEEEKDKLRIRLGIRSDVKVLIYIGSMARFRRLNRLIEAYAMICDYNKEVRLLMVGDGDNLKDIVSLSGNLGIDKFVIFTGRVPPGKVVDYIRASDIGISYVPINDNYTYNPPLKTFEYLACGLPVVATSTVSNKVIIQDQINGVLVPDKSMDIAKAAIDLLSNTSKLERIRQNAAKSVARYDIETITKEHLLSLYNDILGC